MHKNNCIVWFHLCKIQGKEKPNNLYICISIKDMINMSRIVVIRGEGWNSIREETYRSFKRVEQCVLMWFLLFIILQWTHNVLFCVHVFSMLKMYGKITIADVYWTFLCVSSATLQMFSLKEWFLCFYS